MAAANVVGLYAERNPSTGAKEVEGQCYLTKYRLPNDSLLTLLHLPIGLFVKEVHRGFLFRLSVLFNHRFRSVGGGWAPGFPSTTSEREGAEEEKY